jgi:hypothetical protein
MVDRRMPPRPEFAVTGDDVAVVEHTVALGHGVVADCVVADLNGRPALTELRLRSAYEGRTAEITARFLKSIRFGDLLEPARQGLAELASDPLWAEAASMWGFLREQPRPGRAGHPDKVYALVALRYVRALERGSARPVADVAKAMGLSRSRVRDLLHEARRRGLLTRPPRGRAGGEMTELGWAALTK